MEDSMKIQVTKDGPYIVYGNVPLYEEHVKADAMGRPLKWERGKDYETKGTYSLCRCGMSDNMPFCTGKHLQGFDGTETADNDPYFKSCNAYDGCEGVILVQKPILCVGAGFCHGVHNISKTVQSQKTLDIAEQQTFDCPGGSLTLIVNGEAIEPELKKEISVTSEFGKMGPLWVKGGIPIISKNGEEYEIRNRVALCRCGGSENKPFCDSAHKR